MNKIINRKTEETIIEDENLSIKELVEKAVREKISLEYADLYEADLTYVDFNEILEYDDDNVDIYPDEDRKPNIGYFFNFLDKN